MDLSRRHVMAAAASVAVSGFSEQRAPREFKSRFAALERVLDSTSLLSRTPGCAIGVTVGGELVFRFCRGLADQERSLPCTPATNFRIASITKSFTACAVLRLVKDGRIKLDETMPDLFSEVPQGLKEVSVRHLLTHSSGLAEYVDLAPAALSLPLDDVDVLRLILSSGQTSFPPGSRFRYSDAGYCLLALAVEQRAGVPFERFVQTAFFRPLQMRGTVAYRSGLNDVPNRAFGYTADGTTIRPTDQSVFSALLGDGGIYSSIEDLARWIKAWDERRALPVDLARLAETPTAQSSAPDLPYARQPGGGYGMGWGIGSHRGRRRLYHSGGTIGFTSRIERFSTERLGVVVLTNENGTRTEDLGNLIADTLLS